MFGWGHMSVWLALLAPLPSGFFMTLLNGIVMIFGYTLFVMLLVLLVFVISKVIVVPFNSYIAEKVLKHYEVIKEQPLHLNIWIRRTLRMMLVTIVQMLFFTILGVLLFVLSFIPVVNILVIYVGFIIVAFDCADYAMEMAELGFKDRIALFKRRWPEFCGFAAVMGLTFLVPFLNFFLLPISVAGASWLLGSFDELWSKNKG